MEASNLRKQIVFHHISTFHGIHSFRFVMSSHFAKFATPSFNWFSDNTEFANLEMESSGRAFVGFNVDLFSTGILDWNAKVTAYGVLICFYLSFDDKTINSTIKP